MGGQYYNLLQIFLGVRGKLQPAITKTRCYCLGIVIAILGHHVAADFAGQISVD